METTSPPVTPIRQYMSPLETSPSNSYHEQLRRRTSSFSSNHDRSPRKNRFSNASQYSNEAFTPDGGDGSNGMGMGNLADELDQLDDEEEYDEDNTETAVDDSQAGVAADGARDSGIDVSYSSKKSSPYTVRSFASKPSCDLAEKPPDEEAEGQDEDEDKLPSDLEDAINSIARITTTNTSATATDDPLIPRTVALLQDLGNQSTLEAHTQRLTTSTNSMTSHLTSQSKALQALSTSLLYSPFIILDPIVLEETTPLVEALLADLPKPDPAPLQGIQKLDRETGNVISTLSGLTDTLQMGKQTTNTASRHLRTTQTMVVDLRRERERAEAARFELRKNDEWESKIKSRWCAGECKDIMGGFESLCADLRERLAASAGA